MWADNQFYLINNTIIDNRPANGVFMKIKPSNIKIIAMNNLLVGKGKLDTTVPGEYKNNINVEWDEFVQAQREDYRLKSTSKLIGRAIYPGVSNGVNLRPTKEYHHPRGTVSVLNSILSPGALQTLVEAINH